MRCACEQVKNGQAHFEIFAEKYFSAKFVHGIGMQCGASAAAAVVVIVLVVRRTKRHFKHNITKCHFIQSPWTKENMRHQNFKRISVLESEQPN